MQLLKKQILSYFCPYVSLLLLLGTLSGCALFGTGRGDKGEFTTVARTTWTMEAPNEMVLVPGGSFTAGEVGEDPFGTVKLNRIVTVSPFFMDQSEITNRTYRTFIDILLEKVEAEGEGKDEDAEEGEEDEEALAEDEEENSPNQKGKESGDEPKKDVYEAQLTKEFIETKLSPDPNVWKNDFAGNMADIYMEGYYDHPAFDNYPVVGVSWEAAKLFAVWRTKYLNEYREGEGMPRYPSFSLPSAAQWEYAARGGKELAKYPWGGPYIRDYEGNLRANFKSGKGNYNGSGYTYTSPVDAFPPNEFGLYDMAGNVSEWTLDAYNPASVSRMWDLDPLYLDSDQPMKVIKGGSWKDISRFLQTGAADYEHKDTTRSYIGFRCVIPYTGANDPRTLMNVGKPK